MTWSKYFKIAERQLETGKFKNCESHALKALESARAANDQKQIAQSLDLLKKLYLELEDNAKAGEMMREAVWATEAAYGAGSTELANELFIYGLWLKENERSEEGEAKLAKALDIWEERGDDVLFLVARDALGDYYMTAGRFAEAEKLWLRSIDVTKRHYGPTSYAAQRDFEVYCEILEQLGRTEELATLSFIRGSDDAPTIGDAPEFVAIMTGVQETMKSGDIEQAVEGLRKGIEDAKVVTEKFAAGIAESDPFRELKLLHIGEPLRYLESAYADVIRLKGQQDENMELVYEAADIYRRLIKEEPQPRYLTQLLLTLVDLGVNDKSVNPEIEDILDMAKDSVVSLYTKALVMFRREGSTHASRDALRVAFNFNPHVPSLIGGDDSGNTKAFKIGDFDEAKAYASQAQYQWVTTPGAAEFMVEVVNRALPALVQRLGFDASALKK